MTFWGCSVSTGAPGLIPLLLKRGAKFHGETMSGESTVSILRDKWPETHRFYPLLPLSVISISLRSVGIGREGLIHPPPIAPLSVVRTAVFFHESRVNTRSPSAKSGSDTASGRILCWGRVGGVIRRVGSGSIHRRMPLFWPFRQRFN